MPIYNNDYQMLRRGGSCPRAAMAKRCGDLAAAVRERTQFGMEPQRKGTHGLRTDAEPDEIHTLRYNDGVGNGFRASYAYNGGGEDHQQRSAAIS